MNMKSPKEEKVATAIEQQTARLPPDIFLWTAVASIGVSIGLKFTIKNITLYLLCGSIGGSAVVARPLQ